MFLTAFLFLGPPLIVGAPLGDTILAQQILLDLLQGKSTGYVKLIIKPIVNGKEFTVLLNNKIFYFPNLKELCQLQASYSC